MSTIDHGSLGPDHPAPLATDCPHCQRITRFCIAFREFGYTTLTIAETRDAYHHALSGEPLVLGGVIAMLIHSQLVEGGLA